MGYIGNQQTEGYSQVPPKQDLTGATGTTLTLSNAVASAEGIDLFINNVRQEPTTAYSVGADGVTVTLTGSVVATDDIYVVYNSLARQTSTHPSNQALQATSGTFSGAVSAASATVTGDLTVDTNTLYVDSTNNRVGVGQSSPNQKLDVNGNIVTDSYSLGAGNGIFLRRGFETNAQPSITVEDHSGSAPDGLGINGGDGVSFRTSGTERMRLTADGRLLHNTTSTTLGGDVVLKATNNNALTIHNARGTSGYFNQIAFSNNTGSAAVGSIVRVNDTSVQYNTSSDYRLKENVVADWDATTRLKQLNPVRFNFIADASTTVDGFLAHEVQTVVPEAISGTHDEVDDDGNPVYQGIDQSKLVPLLVKTIQELEARIAALEAN